MSPQYIPIKQITPNPFQSRIEYGDIPELAQRIMAMFDQFPETFGLMQIPHARQIAANQYQLLYGHRRHRAFQWLNENGYGYPTMPLHIILATDQQMLDAVWEENNRRRDLSPTETAKLLQLALNTLQCSQKDLETHWRLSRSTIAHKLRLLHLPPKIQQANIDGTLSERQCQSLHLITSLIPLTHVEWGGFDRPDFYPPMSPEKFLDYLLDHPDLSSEQIREIGSRMLRYAGERLPGNLANIELQNGHTIQPTCNGCSHHIHNYCLHPNCLTAKKQVFAQHAISAAQRIHNYPAAFGPEPFAIPSSISLDDFKSHIENGCPSVVVGFLDTGYAYRPAANGGHFSQFISINETEQDAVYRDPNHSRGIVLGYTHPPNAPCPANIPTVPAYDKINKLICEQHSGMVRKLHQMVKNLAGQNPHAALSFLASAGETDSLTPDDLLKWGWQNRSLMLIEDASGTDLQTAVTRLADRLGEKMPPLTPDEQIIQLMEIWRHGLSSITPNDAQQLNSQINQLLPLVTNPNCVQWATAILHKTKQHQPKTLRDLFGNQQ